MIDSSIILNTPENEFLVPRSHVLNDLKFPAGYLCTVYICNIYATYDAVSQLEILFAVGKLEKH